MRVKCLAQEHSATQCPGQGLNPLGQYSLRHTNVQVANNKDVVAWERSLLKRRPIRRLFIAKEE